MKNYAKTSLHRKKIPEEKAFLHEDFLHKGKKNNSSQLFFFFFEILEKSPRIKLYCNNLSSNHFTVSQHQKKSMKKKKLKCFLYVTLSRHYNFFFQIKKIIYTCICIYLHIYNYIPFVL